MSFTVTEKSGPIPTLELADEAAASRVVLAPARGGMAIGFTVGGREIFFLDESTFLDRSANVRGGNPVLFPSPGKLTGDRWAQGGKSGSMKQHGFARNLDWDVASTGADGAARATLRLRSNEVTSAQYPWDFVVEYEYALAGPRLSIEQRFTNESDTAMPFGAGFHPYFRVPQSEKGAARITTAATRAFDNVQKRELAFEGFDLTGKEVDMHLLDHGSSEATLVTADGATIAVTGSEAFTHWVVWTLAGRDFVCLEPWTCPGDALNTGERLIIARPGESIALRIEIAVACDGSPRDR